MLTEAGRPRPDEEPAVLAAGERCFRIPSHHPQLRLFLRYLARAKHTSDDRVVLYVHGATFPSALSIAHRFDGRSWRDELCEAGFHVWGLDFHGFGHSDPYPEMAEPADRHPPLGRADDAARQIAAAVPFIAGYHAIERIHLIAHSWGTIAAGLFATRAPELVNRMVLFGPATQRREDGPPPASLPAWLLVTRQAQWERFVAEVPPRAAPVLSAEHFEEWRDSILRAMRGAARANRAA